MRGSASLVEYYCQDSPLNCLPSNQKDIDLSVLVKILNTLLNNYKRAQVG
jgi:hypothetical protein